MVDLFGQWGSLAATGGLSFAVGVYLMKWLGGGMKWLIEYITGRLDKKEATIDAAEASLDQRKDALIDRLEKQIQGLIDRLTIAEAALAECLRKHAESDAKVLQLEALMQAKGDIKQHAALIVAAEKREGKAR